VTRFSILEEKRMDMTFVVRFRVMAVAAALPVVFGACSTPPALPVAPVATEPPPVVQQVAVPVPELSPAQAKAQAQKLAIEAADELQNGDETAARLTLEKALGLDATNELARKLSEQIRADAQKELGPVFFRYTVQRDDSLSKLAQQYLGDRFRFYILAKYNDMSNPARLAAGQVIKIPGRAPVAAVVVAPVAPARPPEVTETVARPPVAEAEARLRDDAAEALRRGRELEAKGSYEAAYAAMNDAALRFPGNDAVARQRDAARVALIRAYDREAAQAFQRQNLDLAIAKWDRVIELDPDNRKARLERERAQDLKKRMNDKFGAK
jgi:tetratricopeptide (TPR) repeat protein